MYGNIHLQKSSEALREAFGGLFGLLIPGLYVTIPRTDWHITPPVCLQAGYQILPWLQIGGDAYFQYAWGDYFINKNDQVRDCSYTLTRLSVLAMSKFTYFNRKLWHIYSAAALGVGINHRTVFPPSDIKTIPPSGCTFAWEVTAVGVSYGNSFYFFTDVGIGSESILYRAGLGYKF